MLLQSAAPVQSHTAEGRKIVLFPGWPAAWGNVSFRLHAPLNTTVEATLVGGKLTKLVVDPPSRKQDIVIAPLQSSLKTDDRALSWPVPNWTTVPTYTFCGPSKRHFNEAELEFISGKSAAGYAPRWMALGYSTLANYPPLLQASCAKQADVAQRIKAVAPQMPVWGGTDWDLLLCDTPTNLPHNATCQMEFDAEMRADPAQMLHCGGELVTRKAAQGRAIHNWANSKTRLAYAGAFRAWRDGAIDGVFWDGLQHRFDRGADGSQDYPTGDGRTSAKCSPDDILKFHAGEVQMVKDGREAIGWGNVTICNDGRGLGNWSFALNDSDPVLAGKPMCSGANFEFYQGEVMDVLGLYKIAQWSEHSGQRYLVAIRGLSGHGSFARHLAGFLVAAGRDSYFLEYDTYNCDDSNGKPPFAGSQLQENPQYAKPLGEPEPTQLHSFATTMLMADTDRLDALRVAAPSCDCLVGDDMTAEGAPPPAPSDKYRGTCMQWDGSCEQCQAGTDRRCAGGSGGPWCNSPCVFLSESICSAGQCHQCQPLAWVKESCPGKFCGNATACKNGTCTGICDVNHPPPPPPPTAPSVNTTGLWLSTTDNRPAAGLVYNLSAGVSRCECVFTRRFASGTKAYFNATTWRTGSEVSGAVASSSASCVLWSDNTTLDNAGGCLELQSFATKSVTLKTDALVSVAGLQDAKASTTWQQDRFAISFFAQTHKPPIDDASFRLMRDGNFTTVGLFDHLGSNKVDVATTVLQQGLCKQYGLKCLLSLGNFKKTKNGNRTLPQLSPSQWGFYLADEPNAHEFPSLAKEVAAVRQEAPGSMSFINLLPSNVSGEGHGDNASGWAHEWGAANYTDYAQQLVDIVKPDVVCFDHYPIFRPNPTGTGKNKLLHDTREDYIRNLAMAGAVAHRAKLPLWLYFNIVPYRRLFLEDPTEAQVRWQISIALAYGATGLLYFEWHPMGDGHPGLVVTVDGPPVPSPHYFVSKQSRQPCIIILPCSRYTSDSKVFAAFAAASQAAELMGARPGTDIAARGSHIDPQSPLRSERFILSTRCGSDQRLAECIAWRLDPRFL
jgi:hypothetical protein